MPPVGKKRTSGKGADSAFSIFVPPSNSAGKNFMSEYPLSVSAIISLAVAALGTKGILTALACQIRL
jgi:hypothetical protein